MYVHIKYLQSILFIMAIFFFLNICVKVFILYLTHRLKIKKKSLISFSVSYAGNIARISRILMHFHCS